MIDTLLSRASAAVFSEPGPGESDLNLILEAALRAPDHGKLRPWRFLVVQGEGREKLAELFAEVLLRQDPAAKESLIEKEKGKALRSPVVIVVVAKLVPGHKIPEIEQILSVGAAAMNILNAAHALGYGAKWVTGAPSYDADFAKALGLEPTDKIAGFVHIGTLAPGAPKTERPGVGDFAINWPGSK